MIQQIRFIIPIGMPCSGKSTWIKKMCQTLGYKFHAPVIVVSRDVIRYAINNGKYKWSKASENLVTEVCDKQLKEALKLDNVVILMDNMHINPLYINTYLLILRDLMKLNKVQVIMVKFDIKLWIAQLRNIWRSIKERKWISPKVMKSFHKRYINLDLSQYQKYIYGKDLAKL